jgi:hypothetical protein
MSETRLDASRLRNVEFRSGPQGLGVATTAGCTDSTMSALISEPRTLREILRFYASNVEAVETGELA